MMASGFQNDGAARRRALLALADATNGTLSQKAAAAGVSTSTLSRLLRLRAMADESGDASFLEPGKSTGRKAIAKKLSREAEARLQRAVLKCGSVALAVQHFADDPLCPDEIREKILAMPNPHAIPLSLRRKANVTPEMKARFRGPVAYEHIAFKCRHKGEVIDPISQDTRDLMAGDIYLSDDMSRNRYFWFELPPGERNTRQNRGDKLAERFGVAIGRQGLLTLDAAGKWLVLSLIGCAKDAYNAGDVLRHAKAVLERWGKPRIGWILEKGVWRSRAVDGTTVWCDEDEKARICGGIRNLGFAVEHVHTSEGKALIEGGFHMFQKVQSLYEGAPDIGRRRGEMEAETRLIQRVQAGTVHPVDAGIEHITEAQQNDLKALVYLNGRKKFGRIQHGVPDERWIRDVTLRPLAKLEPREHGVFMPIQHKTEIRQGCVEKKIGGDVYRFTMPDLFGVLGAGYRVMLCFDPSNPAAGADIYNLETGSRNSNGWPMMHHIGHAEHEAARLLYGYSDETEQSIERRKRWHRAFQTATVDTGIFGKRTKQSIEARDGHGLVKAAEIDRSRVSSGECEAAIAEQGKDDLATSHRRGPRRTGGVTPGDDRSPISDGGFRMADPEETNEVPASPRLRGAGGKKKARVRSRFEMLEGAEI